MLSLGLDIGSSSVKACVFDTESGLTLASAQYPDSELAIQSEHPGWAEQDPAVWWDCIVKVCDKLHSSGLYEAQAIGAIGIAYQMHGLVLTDANQNVLRPAIIWCDSRAVECGKQGLEGLGQDHCFSHLLNSPGNFTASKLRWVQNQEKEVFAKVDKFMLPGDYIAMRMSGQCTTTSSGLSEGILWDFKHQCVASQLLDLWGISKDCLPELKPSVGVGVELSGNAAEQLGLCAGIPISYRAGDQPNNALSLNVLEPGEVAATAGTSGVIFAVTDKPVADDKSRLNTFLHVNSTSQDPRLGVLLCINGTGRALSWLKALLKDSGSEMSYEELNRLANLSPVGSDGLIFTPYGNGAERILQNQNPGASLENLDFNRHGLAHLLRATQEGIAFALNNGFELLKTLGCDSDIVRVGQGNMFLSDVFSDAFVNTAQVAVEVFDTNGAEGAARAAALGAGHYSNYSEAMQSLKKIKTIEPDTSLLAEYEQAYGAWKETNDKQSV